MRAGCIASLALWAFIALLLARPALLPLVAVLVPVVVVVWAVNDPDWPLY